MQRPTMKFVATKTAAILQLASNRRRKAIEIAIKRGDAGRLLVDRVGYVGVILIGCDSDESEQKHEKHEKTRQCEADHFIGARFPVNRRMNRPIHVTAINTATNKIAIAQLG